MDPVTDKTTSGAEETNNAPVQKPKPNGGLYSRVNVSVKTINIVIAVGLAALILVLAFVVTHNGFTITFDTDGGSRVASVVGKYGETIAEPETPVREGSTFTGWYSDSACTVRWDFGKDTPTGDLTLYAGWENKNN